MERRIKGEEKGGKFLKKENIFFEEKEENSWRRFFGG